VQADRPGAKPMPDLQQLGASYGAVETKLVEESPFWKEIDRFYDAAPNLFAATEAWLEAAA
jgi:hypothetical protein